MESKIHPLADVQSLNIGKGTKIWQFVVVLSGAKIGENCNICSHCFIENDVKIGNNVTLKFYVEVCDGVTLEDDVFIAPNVSFTNDFIPRSKKYFDKPIRTKVEKGASISAGACIKPGVTIGQYSLIGLGSIVTKDIPPFTIWYGNPAIFKGYITKEGITLDSSLKDKNGNSYSLINGEPIMN